jgi:CP family cyanate transporter-like MFS transporter
MQNEPSAADVPNGGPPAIAARAFWLPALCLVLVAFNMRVAVTSLGPVLRDAVAATGMSAEVASVLTTVPTFCFGLFGPAAPLLARRFGTDGALLLLLALLAAGCAARGFGDAPLLFAGQILACLSIGMINVLLPSLVKRRFPRHVALITGFYTMAFCAGAAIAAGATVPIQKFWNGSWAPALAFWSLPAALAALAWGLQMRSAAADPVRRAVAVRGLWRDPLAWQVTLFMGLQSALAYVVFGWLVPILRDRGLDAVQAGLALSVSVMAQAAASLVAPSLATRGKDQRLANVAAVGLCQAGLLGCMYGPIATVWLWSLLLGLAQGALISLALTIIVLRSPDAQMAAQLSSMTQGVGYLIASAGPLLAGLLHGWTGSWNSVAVFCVAIGFVQVPIALGAGRALQVGAAP